MKFCGQTSLSLYNNDLKKSEEQFLFLVANFWWNMINYN